MFAYGVSLSQVRLWNSERVELQGPIDERYLVRTPEFAADLAAVYFNHLINQGRGSGSSPIIWYDASDKGDFYFVRQRLRDSNQDIEFDPCYFAIDKTDGTLLRGHHNASIKLTDIQKSFNEKHKAKKGK